MNLSQLSYFIAIAECGNLTAAAERVGVTRQALSQYIAALREETGHELFYTVKRHFLLTDSGKRYYDAAQEILSIINRTEHSFSLLDTAPKHIIKVGVTPMLGVDLINKCLSRFSSAYPDLRLDIITDDASRLKEYARSREVDLALANQTEKELGNLQHFSVFRSEYVLGVSSFHHLAHEYAEFDELPVLDFADLKDEVFIMFDKTSHHHSVLQEFLDQAPFRPTIASTTGSIAMNKAWVQQGYGIGFMHYEPVKGISFLRLREPPYEYVYAISDRQHAFSEPERYLIYLMSRQQTLYQIERTESEQLMRIYHEFIDSDYYN